MNDKDSNKVNMQQDNIPFATVLESVTARSHRVITMLIRALVIAIICLLLSNAVWLYAWMQYDYSSTQTETVELQSDNAPANYIKGNGGIITNGESESNDNKDKKSQDNGKEQENEKEKINHE